MAQRMRITQTAITRPPRHHTGHDHGTHVRGRLLRWQARERRDAAAIDPVCGMRVDPATAKHRLNIAARNICFAVPAAANVLKPTRKNSSAANRPSPRHRPAPSTPVRCIRRYDKSVREAVRSAAWRWSPNKFRSTRRRDPELLDMTRRFWIALALTLAGVRDRDGQPSRPDASGAAGVVELDFAGAGDAGGAVGGRAVFRARLALAALHAISTCSR